jgi:hypothetical protein
MGGDGQLEGVSPLHTTTEGKSQEGYTKITYGSYFTFVRETCTLTAEISLGTLFKS